LLAVMVMKSQRKPIYQHKKRNNGYSIGGGVILIDDQMASKQQSQSRQHMTDNVIPIGGLTKLDIPIDRVLSEAKGILQDVIIIGYDKEGNQYNASTIADGGEILWMIEQFKLDLLDVGVQVDD